MVGIPEVQPARERRARSRAVHAADDPAVSDEASFAAMMRGEGGAKHAAHEARAFFASIWDARQMGYASVRNRMLGWYRLHGAEVLMRLWQEALANDTGKEPFWYFVNALSGQTVSRTLATATQAAPAVRVATGAPAGVVEGGVVRTPDGLEARVDAITNGGKFAMLEGDARSWMTSLLTPVAGVGA